MNAKNEYPSEHQLDRLLSGFFKAEMPDPFPALKAPARLELPMPLSGNRATRSLVTHSRLSLAASVALILGGCWCVSSQIGTPAERTSLGKGDGSAKITKEILKAQEEAKKSAMP